MPWSAEDFKRFSKDLTDVQAQKAARMANRILASCLRRGGTQDDCERIAIATALDRVKGKKESSMDESIHTEAKYTLKPWDGSFSRFTIEQLLRSVPKAIAEWAREQAKKKGREVIKDDLRLPYKEPDGTINIRAVRNALARLPQVKGIPQDVLARARKELEDVLDAYNKSKGEVMSWVQSVVQVLKPVAEKLVPRENGTVLVKMTLARAGLWDFTDDYNTKYVALESPEDVFSESFIEQWKGLPIILDHEPGDWIDETNIKDRIVGVVLSAERSQDGDYLVGEGVLWAPEAIRAINEGIVELSKGYACDVIDESGVWPENGELKPYNKIHTNFQLNHVAIVKKGKCGGPCRIMVQSVQSEKDDHVHTECRVDKQKTVNGEDAMTELKFNLGGKEFVITDESGAKLFQEALNKHLEELEKARAARAEKEKADADLAKANERIVALEAEAKVYRAKCEEFEKRVKALESGEALQALVSERLELVRTAEEKIPNFVATGKSNRQIMVEVIKRIDPAFSDENRSDSEVKAVYEAILRAEAVLKANEAKTIGVTPVESDLQKRLAEARERARGRSARLPSEEKKA